MLMTVTGNGVNGTFTKTTGVYMSAFLSPGAVAAGSQTRIIGVQRQTAADKLTPWTLPADNTAPVVAVSLTGRKHTVAATGITLSRYEVSVTRRFRQQTVECHYPVAPAAFKKLPINYANTDTYELSTAALKSDYTFGLAEYPEHLLAFKMAITPAASPVYVLSKPANVKNSFFKKVVELVNAQAADPAGQFPAFAIQTAQGNLPVTTTNLLRAYSFFRYGDALQWPFPSMRDWVRAAVAMGAGGVADLTEVEVPEPNDEALIRYDIDAKFTPAEFPYGIETLVLVYKPGGPVLSAC